MDEQIFEPLPIKYTGFFADGRLVDANQFGQSVATVIRVGNVICYGLPLKVAANPTLKYGGIRKHVSDARLLSRPRQCLKNFVAGFGCLPQSDAGEHLQKAPSNEGRMCP